MFHPAPEIHPEAFVLRPFTLLRYLRQPRTSKGNKEMQCIIRIAALSLTAFASLPAYAADFRSEVQQCPLAHQLEDSLKRRGFEMSELITGMGRSW